MKFEKIIQSAKNVPKTVGISNLAILAKKAKNSFQNLTLVIRVLEKKDYFDQVDHK